MPIVFPSSINRSDNIGPAPEPEAHGMAVVVRQKAQDSAGMIQAIKDNAFAPMEADPEVLSS